MPSIRQYQTEGIDWLYKQKRGILGDAPGCGKEQPADTRVATPSGWIEIGSLKVGDYVIGSHGKPVRVRGVFPQGVKPSYRVTFSDRSSVESGLGHLWTMRYNRGGRKFVDIVLTTEQLLTRPQIWNGGHDPLSLDKTSLYCPMLVSPVQYKDPEQTLKIGPYTMGALLANGSLAHRAAGLTLGIHYADEVRAKVKEEGHILSRSRVYGNTTQQNVSGILPEIRELGLNVGSRLKFIPEKYLRASIEDRIDLLHGLMDGDGTISLERNRVVYCSICERLAIDVQELVEGLGGSAHVRVTDRTSKGKPIEYNVCVRLPNGINPFTIKCKASRFNPGKYAWPVRVLRSVEYVRNVEQVCIAVESEDQLYVTEHCILTHNTLQALGLADKAESGKVLVVCPKSLLRNWSNEIEKWCSGSTWAIVSGSKVQRAEIIRGKQRFTIVGYPTLITRSTYTEVAGVKVESKSDAGNLGDLACAGYDCIIFDEAHRLRNRSSKMMAGAKYVVARNNPEYLALLTGTPIVNSAEDQWPLLHLIDKDTYSSYWKWARDRFKSSPNRFNKWALGEPFNAAQLKEELRPYLLRRAKADVLPELPKETYITLDVELDTTQRRLYEQMRKKRFVEWGGKTIDSPSAMVALNRLRQIAVGPETLVEDYGQILTGCKADAIMEILEGLDDQKFIIFSQYARAIRCLYPLVKRSMGVAMFTGQDSTNYRTEQERLLREDDNTRGLMSTYQAGGEGSNYTDASIVICLDLWWAPAVNAQAVGRCSRMGQKSPVTIYSINAVNTVESRVLEKINSKLGLFDQLITEQRVLGYALEELDK